MRVLAVDPGIVNCGVAVVELRARPEIVLVHTEKQKSSVPPAERKTHIGRFVMDLLRTASVDLVVVEDQMGAFFGHQARGTTNAGSVHLQGLVDLLRGVVLCSGDYPFLTLSPQQVRFRLGLKRTATKELVEKAVKLRLGCPPDGSTEHSTDALAIALAGAAEFRLQNAVRAGSS